MRWCEDSLVVLDEDHHKTESSLLIIAHKVINSLCFLV